MNQEVRKNRIIARGEFSDHCHVITGNATVERTDEGVFVNVEDSTAVLKHLLESKWVQGIESWTNEHADCAIEGKDLIRQGDVMLKKVGESRYKYIQQIEYDPFEDIIREVRD